MKKILLFIIFILCISQLSASQRQTDNIAQISASSLYNIDKKALKSTIKSYINTHKNLIALKIVESLSGETYYEMNIKDKNIQNYIQYTATSKFEGEKVGEVFTYYASKERISLTLKEKEWLNKNPIILSVDDTYAPMNFRNFKNQMDGLSIDYIKLIEKKIGVPIKLDSHPWPIALDNAMKHKTDGVINANKNPRRAKKLIFTDSYITVPMVLITSEDQENYKNLAGLENKTILVREKTIESSILPKKYPLLNIQEVKNYRDAFNFVSTGKADGVFGHMAVLEYEMNKYLLPNVKKNFVSFNDVVTNQSIAIRNTAPMLKEILDKAIASISTKQKEEINNKWMKPIKEDKDKLSSKEINWLKQNPPIMLAVVDNYPPYDFRGENNKLNGFHTDVTNLINKNLGINIKLKAFDSWSEAYNSVLNNSTDGIYSLSWSKKREEKYFNYSPPYHFSPYHLVVKGDNKRTVELEDIVGKTIAVEQDTIFKNIVEEKAPKANILFVKNTKEAYKSVYNGKAFATISPNIKDTLFKNSGLNVASEVYHKSGNLYVGTNKKSAIITSIISKGINSISLSDIRKLRQKWFTKTRATIELNEEEKKWIEKNPEVKIIQFFDEPPFTLNAEKKSGYVYELVEYLVESSGLQIKYIDGYSSYGSMLESIEKQTVDVLTTFPTSLDLGKKSNIVPSKSVLKTPFVIIGKNNANVNSVEDLYGKKVAVVKGYAQDHYLGEFPKIERVYVENNSEGFSAIRNGIAEYYINNRANTEYVLNVNFATDLNIIYELPYDSFPPLSISFAMNGKNTTLVSILSKALEQIPYKKIKTIRDKWIVSTSKESRQTNLTTEERLFLKNHPDIVLGADQNWHPFDFRDKFGKHAGFNADYLDLIRKKTGLNIKIKLGTWVDLQSSVKNKKLAGLVGPTKTVERDTYMSFTEPYYMLTQVILSKNNVPSIKSLNELNDKTLAIKSGSSNVNYIKKNYPDINIKIYNSNSEVVRAVSFGKVDFAITNMGAASYESKRNFISNIKVSYNISELFGDMRFGIRKDWSELTSIIQKGIDAITREEIDQILSKWLKLANTKTDSLITLTKKEKEFILKHPIIRVHNEKSWAPYNFYEKGRARGLSIDYIKALASKAGLKIEFISGPTWDEFMNMSKNKDIDVMLNIVKSPEREKFLNFTKPYSELYQSLYIRKGEKPITKTEELYGKTFAVPKGFYYEEKLKEYPKIKLLKLNNTLECIQAVSFGKADAALDLTAVVNYYKNKHHIDNIKMGGTLGWEGGSLPLNIGIRKDWPELVSILNKSLEALEDNEIDKIEDKWLFSNSQSKENMIDLTKEEKKWIRDNNVKVGIEEWAPVVFSHGGKDFDGITGDVLRLVTQKTGLNFEVVNDLWNPLLEKFKRKELDLLPATYYTDERATYGLYSQSYYKMLDYIYVRDDDTKINSMRDLIGKKVAIPKGFGTIPKINEKFPGIKIIETKNLSDSIQRVLNGDVDALYDGQIAVEYQMQEDLIVGLKGIPQKEFNAAPLYFFSHIDKPILRNILDKAIKDIPPYEINKIKSKWILENSKRKTLLETKPDTDKLTLSDILPIKEIAFGLVIFLIVFYLIWKFQVKSTNKDMTLKSTLFVIIGLFLFFASAITILTLQNIEKSQKSEIEESLKTVVNSTYKTIKIWVDAKFRRIDIVLDNETLINQITKLKENKELLPEVKSYFEKYQKVFEDAKYYLVSNKLEVILSSVKDYKLSKFDRTAIKKMIDKNSLRKLTVFPSKTEDSIQENILFIKAIKDTNKKSISFLVMELDPTKEFTRILQNGRIGRSGETYTFNNRLQLTSNSRFDKDLRKLGLLEKGKSSILNIDIKDRYSRPTYLAQKALEKTSGISTVAYEDYRFVKVYGAWIWDDELELTFATEIDEDEAMGAFMNMKKTLIIIVFSIIAFTIFLTVLTAWISTRSKKSLEKANDDLNRLLESFDENVIASRSDLHGNITYASKAFVEISGYSLEELMGAPHSMVRHPDTPKEVFKDLWRTIKSGKVWKGEIKNRRKDGSYYWVDVVVTPKLEDDGNILSYSAIRQDITSKKEVEELSESLELKVEERTSELKESELRLHTLFDAAPDSIAIIKDGKYISCNKKTLDLFGYITNKSFCNSSPSDNSPDFQENGISSEVLAQKRINDALEKKYSHFEWKHKRNDTNEEFDAEVILAKITLGDEPHIYAVVRDISERKQLERQIKENQEQMTFVSQYANFGFWNFNPQVGDLHVNNIFVEMLGYDSKQVLENGHENQMFKPFKDGLAFWEQLLHPEDAKKTRETLTAHINGETELYKVEYRMKKADGSWMWSLAMGRIAEYDSQDRPIRFNGVNIDIEDSKKAEFEIQQQKEFVSTLLDSQEQIVITTDGVKLRTANKAFLNFFDIKNVQYFLDNLGDCICDTFEDDESNQYIQKMMGKEKWIDYVYNRPEIMHKAMMKKDGQNHIFTISSEKFIFDDEELETAVFTDITELEKIREEVEKIHKHTKDSIEYASLIQHALIPERSLFQKYFKDYFSIWQPKDIVGGDIYLFEELRNENECLLMAIDCTGHGVPGAFVTMLVKAIERQITSNIINSDEAVSPAKILSIFNKSMKHLLKQNHEDSLSNAGFDGGIIYYNKEERIIRFAGAETPLFYFDANDKFKTIKGNRHSIGYKKSNIDYEFTDHTIKVKSGMKFYISTDGYFDQNGGEKGFPLGKSRFKEIIENNHKETFEKQKELLTENLRIYQDDEERNDDITLVGFEINSQEEKITKLNVKDTNWSI